jgi:sensor histidine kinase YesM
MRFFENILKYQKTNRLASHILFWLAVELLSLASSRYHDGNEFSYRFALIGNGLYLLPQIIATYFLTYLVVPRFFFQKRYISTLLVFVAGSYLVCLLERFLMVRVAEPIAGIAPKTFETNLEIITDLPKLFYVYFFQVFSLPVVFMFVKLLKDQLEIQKQTLTLEKEKAEMELKLLKTQLNPHFLFNTLNNIYSLSLANSPVTSASIGRLSEMLDYMLYRCNRPQVPLSGEIDLLNNYIGLEKLRYGERLEVKFNILIEKGIRVPPLILLSIVENAFKHGAGEDTGSPIITIDLEARETVFLFKVVNSFVPKDKKEVSSRVGLINIRRQLELIYPGRHELEITAAGHLFTVSLTIAKYEDQMPAGG